MILAAKYRGDRYSFARASRHAIVVNRGTYARRRTFLARVCCWNAVRSLVPEGLSRPLGNGNYGVLCRSGWSWQLVESKTKRTRSVTVKRPTRTTSSWTKLTSRVLLNLNVISAYQTGLPRVPEAFQPRARLDLFRDSRSPDAWARRLPLQACSALNLTRFFLSTIGV